MPPKRGLVGRNTTFGGYPPHMRDDFDLAKELARKELEEHHKKLQEGKSFLNRVTSLPVFNKPKLVYEEDVPLP